MRDRRKNLSAGVLAVLTLVVVGFIVLWFARDAGWWGGGYAVEVRFDRAPGVRPGTPVTVGGLNVGHVRSAGFADPALMAGGVVVELALDSGRALRRGAVAHVVSGGVASNRMSIEIDPGGAGEPALESGSAIHGDASAAAASLLPSGLVLTLERSADKLGAAVDALTPLLTDMQRIVEPRSPSSVDMIAGTPGNLSSTLARLDAAARGLTEVLGDEKMRIKLRDGVDNLYASSVESRKLMTDAAAFFAVAKSAAGNSNDLVAETRAAIAKTSERVDESAGKLNRNLDLLGSILAQLDPIAAKIARGEGTLGRMAADDRLYETLLLSLKRMGEK